MQSSTMAQMVKAIRMILGMDSIHSKQPLTNAFDIEIEDDAPKRRPTLEEIDALEVCLFMFVYLLHSNFTQKFRVTPRIKEASESVAFLGVLSFHLFIIDISLSSRSYMKLYTKF